MLGISSNCTVASDEFLDSLHLFVLTKENYLSLVAPVTEKKIYDTLKSMPRNKTPGPDGYPVEFFLASWECIGPFFIEAV